MKREAIALFLLIIFVSGSMGFAITEHHCSSSGESRFYWTPTFTHDCKEKQAETSSCKEEKITESCCKKTEKEPLNNCISNADFECCSIDDTLIRVNSSFSASNTISFLFHLTVICFHSNISLYKNFTFLEYKPLSPPFLVKRGQQSLLSTFRI
jgi:hypothetical protein